MLQAALGLWAQAEFKLKHIPSPSTISKILKAKHDIKLMHNEVLNSKSLTRKRKRYTLIEDQNTLERKLLTWIQNQDRVYGGRIALPVSALLLQAKSIALEDGLEFDPKQFNFSTK